jgi:hypothetical protein
MTQFSAAIMNMLNADPLSKQTTRRQLRLLSGSINPRTACQGNRLPR